MPRTRLRYNWRQNLSQPRVIAPPISTIDAQNAINARLAQFPLEQQAREAQLSRAAAAEAQARYKLSKEIETDRQRTAFYNGLQELEQSIPKLGTKEHAEAFAAYAHEFPLARSSSDVAQMLKLHATVNDEQAALKQRMIELNPPPEKIAQRYARVQGDIQQFTEESAQQEAANIAAKKAGVPYTNAPKLHAAQTEAQLLESQYPTLLPKDQQTTQTEVPSLPTQVITDENASQGPPESSVPSVTPAPVAAIDPRMELAKRALDDPNATEAHKAAARQILGVQEDNAE